MRTVPGRTDHIVVIGAGLSGLATVGIPTALLSGRLAADRVTGAPPGPVR